MMTDEEWKYIASRVFKAQTYQAPAFLWTRVLAGIEAHEREQDAPWGLQWRWMSRVTAAVAVLVTLGTVFLTRHAALPLDVALEGRSAQHTAIQLASTPWSSPEDSAALVLGGDS